jgi:predicted Zn finger-like uncharacterized protein
MILTCPACSTRYFADDASLGGKAPRVRCAACAHTWRPKRTRAKPGGDPAGDAGAATTAYRVGRPLAPGAHDMRASLMRWGGFAATVLVLVSLAVSYRFDVVAFWPGAAAIYKAAGFAVTADGLVFEGVKAAPGYEGGAPALTVSAVVRNATGRLRPVRPVRISLLDEKRRELFAWTVRLGVSELAPHGAVRFTAKLARPPADAEDVQLALAPEGTGEPVAPTATEILP